MPTDPSHEDLPATRFRRLVVRSWEWELAGCTFVEVHGDGRARVLDGDFEQRARPDGENVLVPVFRLHRFSVGVARHAALSAAIEVIDFGGLDPQYVDHDVSDGSVIDFLLEDETGSKRVHCENTLPEELLALRDLVQEIAEEDRPTDGSPTLTPDQARLLCDSVVQGDGGNPSAVPQPP